MVANVTKINSARSVVSYFVEDSYYAAGDPNTTAAKPMVAIARRLSLKTVRASIPLPAPPAPRHPE